MLAGPLTVRRALLITLLVGGVVRVFATASLALIITNDGTDYLDFAQRILNGNWQPARPDRTPGYPAIIAAVLATAGPNPPALTAVQHALGLAAALLISWAAARRVNPTVGLVAGLCAALDPWLLAYESHLLTECASTLALAAIAAAVLLPTRRTVWRAVVLGLIIAAACLIRPTFQVVAPFALIGWSIAATRSSVRSAALAVLAAAACVAALSPWLLAQQSRLGKFALSQGTGAHLFSGIARVGLLDESYSLAPEMRRAYEPFAGKPMGDGEFWTFNWAVDGLGRGEPVLRDWAMHSIRAHPADYARFLAHAFAWQLNCSLPGSPLDWPELDEAVARVAQPGDGRQYEPGPPSALLDALNMSSRSGPMRSLLRRIPHRLPRGIPQVPLFLCAAALTIAALARREYWFAWLMLGTFAFLAMHAVFLFPNPRYAMPLWVCWYIAPPTLIAWIASPRPRGNTLPSNDPDSATADAREHL